MKTKLITSLLAPAVLLHCTTQAEEVRYDKFFSGNYAWELGTKGMSYPGEPTIDSKENSITNDGFSFAYGKLNFKSAITLSQPSDTLDFWYTVSVHPYEPPLLASHALGLLTLYGNNTIVSGAIGVQGTFGAATTTSQSSACYTLRTSKPESVIYLKPQFSLTNCIKYTPDNNTIHGHIAWDAEQQEFAVSFEIGEAKTDSIQLGEELTFTGLGVSLDGKEGTGTEKETGKESISNIVLIHRTGSIPEPSTGVLTLAALGIVILRRRRR